MFRIVSVALVAACSGAQPVTNAPTAAPPRLYAVAVRNLDGSTRDLTPGAKLKAEFNGWAHDERSFFVSTNERDPGFFDLYEVFKAPLMVLQGANDLRLAAAPGSETGLGHVSPPGFHLAGPTGFRGLAECRVSGQVFLRAHDSRDAARLASVMRVESIGPI